MNFVSVILGGIAAASVLDTFEPRSKWGTDVDDSLFPEATTLVGFFMNQPYAPTSEAK